MVNVTPQNNRSSLLTSNVGKRILFFSLLLIFVLGMLVYSYYSRSSSNRNWTRLFTDQELTRDNLFTNDAYRTLLQDLRTMDAAEYERMQKRETTFSAGASELRTGLPEERGRILAFEGRVTRRIPVELNLSETRVTIQDLRIRSDDRNLTYRVHLTRPLDSSFHPGTRVRGTGVYLSTMSPPSDNTERQQTPEIYLMSRDLSVLERNEPEQPSAGPSSSQKQDEGETQETNRTKQLSPPKNYRNRNAVTTYWNRLLKPLDRTSRLNASDPLFKTMIQEVYRVNADQMKNWVNEQLTPNRLKPIKEAGQHRGEIISFRGQYLQRYKKEGLNAPGDDDAVWEYWIRDQKNHLTYTFYTLRKENFAVSRGTDVKGTGIYLNTQTYELLNPRGNRNLDRHVVVVGYQLHPFFSSPEAERTAPIRWFEYLLGGLIVLTFGIFLIMVYVSLRSDPDGQPDHIQDIRRRKLQKRREKNEPDDISPDNSV